MIVSASIGLIFGNSKMRGSYRVQERFGRRRNATKYKSVVVVGAIIALTAFAMPAVAHPPVASIVVDAQTGQLLEARHPDALHYPASLTKLMTLYLVFSALKTHHLALNERLRVSRHAASREPTKLWLRAGQHISVRNLILGLVTESANDAASVLAEGMAGSEPAFASRMTSEARALGMMHTVFRNASGLPNPEQVTTARDIARLARALILQFPDRYRYFSVHAFKYRGRIFYNHDNLIYHYRGMDGLKTGFTDAAGFNLVSSAVRNGHRLIGVVLGSNSPAVRDRLMVSLLDRAFAGSGAVEIAQRRAPAEDGADGAQQILLAFSPVAPAEAAPLLPNRQRSSSVREQRLWSIQVGAFAHRLPALRLAHRVARADSLIARGEQRIIAGQGKNQHQLYRVRYVGLDRWQALAACKSLRRAHFDCFVRAPTG